MGAPKSLTMTRVEFFCEPIPDPTTLLLNRLLNSYPLRKQSLDSLCRTMARLDRDERRIWLRVHREVIARTRKEKS